MNNEELAICLIECKATCFDCGIQAEFDEVADFLLTLNDEWFVVLSKHNKLLCRSCYYKQDEAVDWANESRQFVATETAAIKFNER